MIIGFLAGTVTGQDKTKVGILGKNIVSVEENIEKTHVKVGNAIEVVDKNFDDTTKIRIGKKELEVVENGNRTQVNWVDSKDYDWDDWDFDKKHNPFNGHWAGLDIGVNGFVDEDYSMYGGNEFMDLNQPKSLEVNLNFLEYNIGFQKNKDNIGLVTGMGLSYNNYKFDNPITIDNVNGIIQPIAIDDHNLKRTKLTAVYLTIPLMLEFQIPVNDHTDRIFLAAGMVGGLNIGSHTKVKWKGEKQKDKGGFNLNPFKYAAIVKLGFDHINLYATYNFSPLFDDGKGPELTPFSIGLSFINF